ncbi:aldo/keto reductase [Pseudonocardia sp. WMMC193]|uniref:aldo/keto reductase n=1 Tax=Pseudonocardia sp. WMMC193 TaxID=2911965 RepID=UPI001F3A41DA|nr:aldo/keto reductase [Pseudonocardia sp. WMMC193]MCF7548606.1 aldo/keto reductase [Pseudonocardia sp. WMMC193]
MLNNGVEMPLVGFGVYRIGDAETADLLGEALAAGYRRVDTAAFYGNEAGVGAAVTGSGIPRDELFVTTKLANPDQGRAGALAAVDRSLDLLGLDHVDLYMIHWPIPAQGRYVETWQALEEIRASGRARAIGVSNFEPEHLDALRAAEGVVPAVNQIELHPGFQQAPLRAYHAAHGIVTEAWSPLARGALLEHPALTELARRRGRSVAQVVLRWHLQLGNAVIPKSATPARIRANLDLFDFSLSEAEMAEIAALDGAGRNGPDPATHE